MMSDLQARWKEPFETQDSDVATIAVEANEKCHVAKATTAGWGESNRKRPLKGLWLWLWGYLYQFKQWRRLSKAEVVDATEFPTIKQQIELVVLPRLTAWLKKMRKLRRGLKMRTFRRERLRLRLMAGISWRHPQALRVRGGNLVRRFQILWFWIVRYRAQIVIGLLILLVLWGVLWVIRNWATIVSFLQSLVPSIGGG